MEEWARPTGRSKQVQQPRRPDRRCRGGLRSKDRVQGSRSQALRSHRVLSPDSIRKIRLDTALVVAGRRMAGQDDATIRREAPMVAAAMVAEEPGDHWEQET